MKKKSKLLWLGLTSVVIATGLNITPASAELFNIGSEKPETGKFPEWYQDSTGLRLDLCLAASINRPNPPNYCLTEPPDQMNPPYVDAFDPAASNFPDESFWWTAAVRITSCNLC